MAMFRLSFFLLFIISFNSYGQLPNKVKKIVGTWEYKKGSGFEVWKEKENQLIGNEYRVNKIGDTLNVEEMTIKLINNNLVYTIVEHENLIDSTVHHQQMIFLGGKRKMNFINMDANTPYSISYSFGFLRKNKLKIKIRYGQADKPVKLDLVRIKE